LQTLSELQPPDDPFYCADERAGNASRCPRASREQNSLVLLSRAEQVI